MTRSTLLRLPAPTDPLRMHRSLKVDGRPVHVLDFGGTGEPIVLVHGLDGSAANWWDVGPDLAAAGYRVIAVDLPGFGRTPLAGRSPRMTAFADVAIAATAAALGDDHAPVHLVGSSMGGPVVLLAASRHRERVASVTLAAPAVPRAGRGPVAWSFVPFLAPFWSGLGSLESRRRMAQDPAARVRRLLGLCYAPDSRTSPGAMAEMVEVATVRDRRDAVRAWTGAARDLFGWLTARGRFHRMAAGVTVPVHLVEGGADPIIPASSVADAVSRHGWAHTRLAGVGHAPMLESPLRFVEATLGNLPAPGGVAGGPDATTEGVSTPTQIG